MPFSLFWMEECDLPKCNQRLPDTGMNLFQARRDGEILKQREMEKEEQRDRDTEGLAGRVVKIKQFAKACAILCIWIRTAEKHLCAFICSCTTLYTQSKNELIWLRQLWVKIGFQQSSNNKGAKKFFLERCHRCTVQHSWSDSLSSCTHSRLCHSFSFTESLIKSGEGFLKLLY